MGSTLDFETLQSLFLDPATLTEEQDDQPPLPRRDPSSHTHLYTLQHVLMACPLTVTYRSKFLRNYSIEYVADVKSGGEFRKVSK